MATPTTGTLNVVGSGGGMAPFPTSVYADPDEAGSTWATGSGVWSEGRWAFQLIDNATGQVYDSGLMDLQCPITNITATAYNRYGAAPIAGCVIYDPGTYYWRVKYQNRDGDWSAWSNSDTFTVAANTRTKIYVDGDAADDSGNGLTPATAKKTLNAALALISGNDYEVILKDDTSIDVTAGTDISSRSGIWIHRSGDGTNKPIVVGKNTSGPIYAMVCGTDTVASDFVFGYDGVSGRFVFSLGSNKSNTAWLNIDTEYITAFAQIPSGTIHDGLVVYGCTMLAQCRQYMIFAGGPRVINILGCTWDQGSEVEHLVRLTYGITGEPVATEFCSVDFTVLDQANRSKTNLRNYSKRYSGAYRSDFRRGTFSVGDLDVTSVGFDTTSSGVPTGPTERFGPYRYDCCRFYMENAVSHPQTIVVHECVVDIVFSSCHVYQLSGNCVDLNWRSNGDDDPIDNLKFIGCSFFNGGNQSNSVKVNNVISNENLLDIHFRGCIFMGTAQAYNYHYIAIINMATGLPDNSASGLLFLDENVFLEPDWLDPNTFNGELRILGDGETSTNWYDIALLNAESFADGNIRELLTLDTDTGQPSGSTTGWQTKLTDITGLFESINGEVFDRTDSTWAAGAWQPVGSGTGGVAGYPTEGLPEPTTPSFLGLSAGGSYIVLQT